MNGPFITSGTPALDMRGIVKTFPGVKALTGVDLTVQFGSIHAIVGENGAGKSTLIKILGGIHAPTAGTIRINGKEVTLTDPAAAQAYGIRMVHQELNLAPDLSVAENIHLGRMPRRGPFVDRRTMYRAASEALARLGARLDPSARTGDLTVSQQQLVEIARAYAAKPRIIVLDEPTSSLSEHEAQLLFEALAILRSEGIAIIYISHRLREVMEIADEVTVLRDGALIESRSIAGITPQDMIQMMVGREVVELFPKRIVPIGETVLEVEGLSDGMAVDDVSLTVRAGEIVGLVGLVGAGRTEVARAIFGLAPRPKGRVRVNGRDVPVQSPLGAMRAGVGYVPEDRKQHGIVPGLSVSDNVSLPTLRELAVSGITRRHKEVALAREQSGRFGISPDDPSRKIDTLSGGNQQKAVIAKWIAGSPQVLILDEPTRGVDVGAKAEIHRIVGELVANGLAVLMISSEMQEILAVSDRVYVMHDGRISAPLDRADLSEKRLMTLAAGETEAEAQKAAVS